MIIREILLICFVSLTLMSCSKENGLIKLRDNNSELLINSSDDFNSIRKLMIENEGEIKKLMILGSDPSKILSMVSNKSNIEKIHISSSNGPSIRISEFTNLQELLLYNERIELNLVNDIQKLDISVLLVSEPKEKSEIDLLLKSMNGTSIKEFSCIRCDLDTLSHAFENNRKLRKLNLSDNNLKSFIVSDLSGLDSLELILSGNMLDTIEIKDQIKIQVLDLSYNRISSIPSNINQISQLEFLFINGNPIKDGYQYLLDLDDLFYVSVDDSIDNKIIESLKDSIKIVRKATEKIARIAC